MLGTSDTCSTGHSSRRTSEPLYYILDCRIFDVTKACSCQLFKVNILIDYQSEYKSVAGLALSKNMLLFRKSTERGFPYRQFKTRHVTKKDIFLLSKIWYIKLKFWNSTTDFIIVLNYNSPCSIWNKPKTTSKKKLFDEHSELNCCCLFFFYLCEKSLWWSTTKIS